MSIEFDLETMEIINKLKQAVGYLACENIIIQNTKKQVDKGLTDERIIGYLKELSTFFNKKIEANQGNADCSNFRYAAGFVDTLIKMPYWRSWMKSIDM